MSRMDKKMYERYTEILQELSLSVTNIALITGYSEELVRKLNANKIGMSSAFSEIFSLSFGYNIDWLLSGEGDKITRLLTGKEISEMVRNKSGSLAHMADWINNVYFESKDDPKGLSRRLKHFLKSKNISIVEAANQMNYKPNHVAKVLNGHSKISKKFITHLFQSYQEFFFDAPINHSYEKRNRSTVVKKYTLFELQYYIREVVDLMNDTERRDVFIDIAKQKNISLTDAICDSLSIR